MIFGVVSTTLSGTVADTQFGLQHLARRVSRQSVDDFETLRVFVARQPLVQELLEVFPTGVCDWSFTGVGQTTPSMPDRTFEDVVTPEQLA